MCDETSSILGKRLRCFLLLRSPDLFRGKSCLMSFSISLQASWIKFSRFDRYCLMSSSLSYFVAMYFSMWLSQRSFLRGIMVEFAFSCSVSNLGLPRYSYSLRVCLAVLAGCPEMKWEQLWWMRVEEACRSSAFLLKSITWYWLIRRVRFGYSASLLTRLAIDLLMSNIFLIFSLFLTLSENGRQFEGKGLCFVIIRYRFLYSIYIYQNDANQIILIASSLLPAEVVADINQHGSFGVVLVSKDEAGEDAVVDGFDGLLLLAPAVDVHAVVGLQDLQDLPLLLLVSRLGQQFGQFMKLLVVDLQQVLLLVQGLRQHGLLLRLLETQRINTIFLKRVDFQLVLDLLAGFHEFGIGVELEADEVVEGIGGAPLLEGPVELIDHFPFHKLLRPHHVPADQDEFLVVVHVVLALPQSQVFVLDHVADEHADWGGANAERGSEGDLIGEFLLEGVEESEGDSDVAGDVLGVVGSHSHEAHRVYEYFLHLESQNYHIKKSSLISGYNNCS